MSTVAGSGSSGYVDAASLTASFGTMQSLATAYINAAPHVLIAEAQGRVRVYKPYDGTSSRGIAVQQSVFVDYQTLSTRGLLTHQ